jgi:hypothetical protein
MSHDIVDNSRLRTALGTEGLVVASWVEDQFANEGSVLTDHADVLVGDQEMDAESAVVSAEADVVESAQISKGDDPCLVDTVVADPVVGEWFGDVGSGLDACVEGVQGRVAVQGSVGPVLVVVDPEGIQLRLEDAERRGRRLLVEESLLGLVEALDLVAGLGVVRGRVFGDDAEALELGLEEHLACTASTT